MLQLLFSKNYWNAIILLTKMSILRRNANSFLGNLWTLIQPFFTILIIAYVMSYILRYSPSTIIPNLVGSLPFWLYINDGIISASSSLIHNGEVLKRSLLPKTYFPIAEMFNKLYTLLYSFIAMYIVLLAFYPSQFTWKIIFIPFLSLPMIISTLSASVMISYLTVYVRDLTQAITIIFNVLYWTLPIIYPYSMVPESKRFMYELNPLFLSIRPMQEVITSGNLPGIILIAKSWIVAALITIISFLVYRKVRKNVIYYM